MRSTSTSGAWTQEFPHALPFRQYLQHGWTASFAFSFLDDGVSSSFEPPTGAGCPMACVVRTRIPALSLRQSPIPRM